MRFGERASKWQNKLYQHWLAHPSGWALGLLILWLSTHVLIASTSALMEFHREGRTVAWWEPFIWEISSVFCLLVLLVGLLRIWDGWLSSYSRLAQLSIHLLLTVPFSILHVVGMVGIRKLVYAGVGWEYDFGHILYEWFYEYRKDVMSYGTLWLVVWAYRFIRLRLQGEASYLSEGEHSPEQGGPPTRLLVRKLGKEFLIPVADIQWVEASGNYANLHVGDSVYPMRITMKKLSQLLPEQTFLRIHRSAIVNLGAIAQLQALDSGDHEVLMKPGKILTLSRRYRDEFKRRFHLQQDGAI